MTTDGEEPNHGSNVTSRQIDLTSDLSPQMRSTRPSGLVDVRSSRVLFDFENDAAGRQWQVVNDGVMGGRSDGRIRITNEHTLEFFGTLSLENNGGFASARSRPKELGFQVGDAIVVRVKGDGRRYTLNLYVPTRQTAFSYRVEFDTKKDEWIVLRVPLEKFVATSFGRTLGGAPQVAPQLVTSLGFLLADKKAGAFKLEIDTVRLESDVPATEDSGRGND